MNIVTCVKQIPDTPEDTVLVEGTTWLEPVEAPILDDTDRYGIELGLQLAESSSGAVRLVSLGATSADSGLREGLAMGATEAVLIEGDGAIGSGALTTARALATVIGQNAFDLVIMGTASTDGSSGLVPQMLGEILGVPTLSNVTEVLVGDGSITVHRQTPDGYDVVTSGLPAVISVTAGSVEPRYPSFKGTMAAKKAKVDHLALGDLVTDTAADSTQTVVAITAAPTRSGGSTVEDDGEAYQAILALLTEKGVI